MSIKSFVLRRWASAFSSGLPANSGLKCNQFNCGNGPGCAGGKTGCAGGPEGITGCTGNTGDTTGEGCGAGSLHQLFTFISDGVII